MRPDEGSLSASVADLAVLEKLLEEHRPKLLDMVRRRLDPALNGRIEPDVVLNEAFFRAQRRWGRRKEQATFSAYAWLYRIVLDCLIEAWRRETRGRRDPRREMPWPSASSVQLGLGLVSPGTSPSEAAVRAELQQRMQQALEMLSNTDREILWMRHYDQLTFGEAAQVLGIEESAATLRYVRALKRLKKLWQHLYPSEGSEP
jgi:RNA polymerase sigma-70 factor (ECF subfamily)